MSTAEWPPTQADLTQDLEALRREGIIAVDELTLPSLGRACLLLGFLFASGDSNIELALRSAVAGLGNGETARAAHALYGLGDDQKHDGMRVREERAGQVFGIGQRQFQRTRRLQVVKAVARQLVKQITDQTDAVANRGYRTPLAEWDDKSWVRQGARQEEPFESGLGFFSRTLVPILGMSEAAGLSTEQVEEILVLWLYNYLEFTVRLEVGPVNYICEKISDANFLDWLPTQLKDDALRIYTDEGGHAQMSKELMRNVQKFTRVRPNKTKPQFLSVLDKLRRDRLAIERDLVTLLFVIVSETLITGSLNQLPDDSTVQQAVRSVAKDHARDERRHHAYFTQLLTILWPRLPRPLRHDAVMLFPSLVHAFLDIDRMAVRKILDRYPRVFPQPGATMAELLTSSGVEKDIQEAAKPTLALFGRVGVLAEPGAIEVFERAGFLVGGK